MKKKPKKTYRIIDSNEKFAAIEIKPCVRSVKMISENYITARDYSFLSFPYIVMVINFFKVNNIYKSIATKIFFGKKSYRKNSSRPFLTASGIISHTSILNGEICLGRSFENNTLKCFVESIISHFWQTPFNFNSGCRMLFGTLAQWKKKSKENPEFVLDLDFFNSNYKLRDFIK